MLIQNLSGLGCLFNIGKKSVNVFINQAECPQSILHIYFSFALTNKSTKKSHRTEFYKAKGFVPLY